MPVKLTPIRIDDYQKIFGPEEIAEIRALARPLAGARVQHVNSTSVGGGVAELLSRLAPLMNDLGLDARWDVMSGSPAFYRVTKAFHNALHGGDEEITPEMFRIFAEASEANRDLVDRDADFVAIHDPQPAGLVQVRDVDRSRWVWRCHIDISEADPRVWGFLRPYLERYDAAMFHLPDYARELGLPRLIIPPAIDPLAEKNIELDSDEIESVLRRFEIDSRRPIVLQVSRFDRFKDPVGVIRAWRIARRWVDSQLVLAGGSASDDPEGQQVLAEVREEARGSPDVIILDLPPDAHRTINALQRGATVVVQKSLREGFGLVVTEAMWKGKPVIGGAVGGIRRQVFHEQTGFLVHSVEGCAFRIRQLLGNPGLARRIGENARQYVHENFLLPIYLKNWLMVLLSLRMGRESVIHL